MSFDSYSDTGLFVAVRFANELAGGRVNAACRSEQTKEWLATARDILKVDPPSERRLRRADIPGLINLAAELLDIFSALDSGALDRAARALNRLLAVHPAPPHLAKEAGVWRIHHHPCNAPVLAMWTSICAEAVARCLADGNSQRIGQCAAEDCRRVFVDTSKNGTRRFCSPSCQGRIKMRAFRARRQSP